PIIEQKKVVDPCCGIGTVLVEALSMGVDIKGSDLNPLVMKGASGNIAHFGYSTDVTIMNIKDIQEEYDVAIIDMPYNLCSVLDKQDQLEMLISARSFARKIVVITVESIDELITMSGFKITDRCNVKKGKTFTRQIIACE
ncbi:TRM11 family methyltransferase, partial [Pseudomonas sp. 2822-15]|uniref:TRM11 family SAM-dependent methyltransferase n=1 Tax=Pseudomonas sp. 2822-15 TaxID=1712677 RepID=UPI001C43AE29